jgi:addiction module HigA family antidote
MDEKPPMHPGEVLLEGYMRPRGVSQYRLAQEMGVPPIRVSEIVRRKRAISADTALRLARFFDDTDEQLWMDLQRRYDLEVEKGKIGEGLAEVRPLVGARSAARAGGPVPLRTLVNSTDLTEWANRRDAQGLLPKVVRSLVLATVGRIESIAFSAEEGVQLGGWDGIVEAPEGNAFVPRGLSAWELGTNRDVKRKADDDYEKRTEDPLGIDPSKATFVFVTPRRWGKKTKWVAAKQTEEVWREVRVYDADDLETWLEFAPGVHIWLSTIAGKHPEGASDLRTYWEGWAGVTDPPMSVELVISGRREATERVLTWLRGRPSSLGLRAESKEEALAFFAAALYQMDPTEREAYFARSLVVDNLTAWRQLSGFGEGLVLVPTFDVRDADVAPASHHTLIPLGKSEGYRSTAVEELPRPRREDVKETLVDMGLPTERVEDLATLARRSLMAFRRKLAVKPQVKRPEWAEPAEARALLAAMLVGAWETTNAGDQEVVAKLAKKPYDDVESDLVRWSNESDPPVRKVGDTWLIASKEDAWGLLASYLTRGDLDVFTNVVLSMLGELRHAS